MSRNYKNFLQAYMEYAKDDFVPDDIPDIALANDLRVDEKTIG